MDHQVVIVGGGPAAHSAALVLGRARKRVLVCDEGKPANRVAEHSHSFFSRDGAPPLELRRVAIEQLAAYDTVQFQADRVTAVERISGGFRVRFEKREPLSTQLLLLALGMEVEDPGIPGFGPHWGSTVIHCPYCHGWEVRDLPWAVRLTDFNVPIDPKRLRSWTDDLIVIADEAVSIPAEAVDAWTQLGYRIERDSIRALHASDGQLEAIELTGGKRIPRKVLLLAPVRRQAAIVHALGLDLGADGYVAVDESNQTSQAGIFAAGDMISPRHQIVFAAASGALTAMAIDGLLSGS